MYRSITPCLLQICIYVFFPISLFYDCTSFWNVFCFEMGKLGYLRKRDWSHSSIQSVYKQNTRITHKKTNDQQDQTINKLPDKTGQNKRESEKKYKTNPFYGRKKPVWQDNRLESPSEVKRKAELGLGVPPRLSIEWLVFPWIYLNFPWMVLNFLFVLPWRQGGWWEGVFVQWGWRRGQEEAEWRAVGESLLHPDWIR